MWVVVKALGRIGDPGTPQHVHRKAPGLTSSHAPVRPHRLHDLMADGEGGVQAGHRVLEDHRYAVTTRPPQVSGRQCEQVQVVQAHRPAAHPYRLRQKPEDAERGHCLTAPGLPHQAHDLSRGNLERHRVNDLERLSSPGELGGEPFHDQSTGARDRPRLAHLRNGSHYQRRIRGSKMSRKPSPSVLSPSTIRAMTIPGTTGNHTSL